MLTDRKLSFLGVLLRLFTKELGRILDRVPKIANNLYLGLDDKSNMATFEANPKQTNLVPKELSLGICRFKGRRDVGREEKQPWLENYFN